MQIEVLGDRYQLQEPIGRGGMATIYRGRDKRMERVVAIKVLRDIYSTDPKFVTRFQREAKAASALQHPNIVQVYDYGQTDGNYFIVMELIDGTDLRRYLRAREVLDNERAIIIAHDVALGLGAAHRRGIVHRDVKPQNVLVGRDGSIKLTDFGIASVYKDINAERLTTTGMTLGTVQYYAPEQAQGEIVSPAADVYALGIVMYEMLTGRTPFDGDSPVAVAMQHIQEPPVPPSQYNPNIPPALEEIILRCLEKVPEMRFRDGSQLARALELLGDADTSETLPFTPGSMPIPPITPNNQIPQRPSASGRGPARPIPPRVPISSPNNMLPNGLSPDVMNGNGHGMGTYPPVQPQQPMYLDQNMYAPPSPPPDSGNTRPFQRGGGQNDKRGSRATTIVTILILLAALLLLGFSVWLAGAIGIIKFPFMNNGATPTQTINTAIVPDLLGSDYATAQSKAQAVGFTLTLANGATSQDGVVTRQSPLAGTTYTKGKPIEVTMGPKMTAVPAIPPDSTLVAAEQLLQTAGLNVIIKDAGADNTLPPNTVANVSPAPGSPIAVGANVTLYVKNYTTASPTVTPTSTTTPDPTPTKTPDPTPTTTPDPTPTTTPTVTPTITPTVTPTITPSPTGTPH